MPKYTLCVEPEEYERFKTDPATRLYLHTYRGGELEIECSKALAHCLCADLEKVIDFGATSAYGVLNVTPKFTRRG